MKKFSVKPLNLRHGKVQLEFVPYPEQEVPMYLLPISGPKQWRQRLVVRTYSAYSNSSSSEEQKVIPFEGGVFLSSQLAWLLYRNVAMFLDAEITEFMLTLFDKRDKDPKINFFVPEGEGLLQLIAEGKASKEIKRGKISFSMQELYSFGRYLKSYAMLELEIEGLRFFRWTEDYFSYDAGTCFGMIGQAGREKLLQFLSDYLEGKPSKAVSVQDRLLFKVSEEDKLLIVALLRPPVELSHERAKELQLFLS